MSYEEHLQRLSKLLLAKNIDKICCFESWQILIQIQIQLVI